MLSTTVISTVTKIENNDGMINDIELKSLLKGDLIYAYIMIYEK